MSLATPQQWFQKSKNVQLEIKDILPLLLERSKLIKTADAAADGNGSLSQINDKIKQQVNNCQNQINQLEAALSTLEGDLNVDADSIRRMENELLKLYQDLDGIQKKISAPSIGKQQQQQQQLASDNNAQRNFKEKWNLPSDSEQINDAQQLNGVHLQIIEEQDSQLDSLYNVVVNQKHIGIEISDELDNQAELLDRLEGNVDGTQDRLAGARRRLDNIYRTSKEKGSLCLILTLIIVVIVLIVVIK
ncbi:hypothetical protein MP228_008450 [Amoeboaphelidium protococcarum]|nr:hypothetical protein MP228_008450 [Amoeboaphelidium protococcarum]